VGMCLTLCLTQGRQVHGTSLNLYSRDSN
jgi:hypothetical protein